MKPFKPAARVASIALALAVGAAFSAAQANAAEPNEPANMKFRQLDKNSNGFIEKNEIRHLPGYEAAFDQADENRDGKLDAGEFLKAESIYDRTRAAGFVADSVLTTKVKAALLNEPNLKSTEVHVESLKGRVMLSGWVESREQKEKAVKIASAVSGVIEVKDGLKVR